MKSRAERSIAQGSLTNSKHWKTHIEGVYPTHIKNSSGGCVYDLNNKKYVDMICGLGTNLLGYGHPLVEKEVDTVRSQGKSPSFPHVAEVELAEQLKQVFPWVERWKFLKTGSEACSAAIRIARAYTRKDNVFSEGYHGWHDEFVSLTPPAIGVPQRFADTFIFPLEEKSESIFRMHSYRAAIITEPVITDDSESRIHWLKYLREECDKSGSLLIFDEVITGFRYKQHSVAKAYNIRPDLIIIGKAMANGYALAAVGGKAEVMNCDYFVSSTYAGEVTALTAAKAVTQIMRENPNYSVDRLWEAGSRFIETFNSYSSKLGFKIEGYATRGVFMGDDLNIALFMQEACEAGLLFGKSWFICHSHIPMLDSILNSCKDILMKMSKALPELKGKMPTSPFSMKART